MFNHILKTPKRRHNTYINKPVKKIFVRNYLNITTVSFRGYIDTNVHIHIVFVKPDSSVNKNTPIRKNNHKYFIKKLFILERSWMILRANK